MGIVPMVEQPQFFFWKSDGYVWIRIIGPGNFINSPRVKNFAKEMISKGDRMFILDLSECPEVDSTFMGTCAFIGLRLRELKQGALRVSHANPQIVKAFTDLGLDQLLQFDPEE